MAISNQASALHAFVRFNPVPGTLLIQASRNVASVTDVATGTYDVNLSAPSADSTPAAVATCGSGSQTNDVVALIDIGNTTASKVRVWTWQNAVGLAEHSYVAVGVLK